MRAVRELLTAWALDLPVAVYYDLRDDGTDPTNAEHNFGLLANDDSEKPAYTAVETLTAFASSGIIAGYYEVEPSSLHALRLDGLSSPSAIVWSDAPGASVTVTVPAKATVIGLLGTPVATTPAGSDLTITVREADGPVYLSTPAAAVDAGAGGVPSDASIAAGGASAGGVAGNAGVPLGGSAGIVGGGAIGRSTTAGARGTGVADAAGPPSASRPDASIDGASGAASESSSCGCAIPSRSGSRTEWLGALALAALWRRRRCSFRTSRSRPGYCR